MTQTDRTLAALHAHRERGICAVDFLRFPTIDGGPPITRLAARVEELRAQGFRIVSGERRDKCTVYRIDVEVPAAEQERKSGPAGDSSDGHLSAAPTLFDAREAA